MIDEHDIDALYDGKGEYSKSTNVRRKKREPHSTDSERTKLIPPTNKLDSSLYREHIG